jgi:hypothetical protein
MTADWMPRSLLLTAAKVAMAIAVIAIWVVVGRQYWESPHTVHSLGGVLRLLLRPGA